MVLKSLIVTGLLLVLPAGGCASDRPGSPATSEPTEPAITTAPAAPFQPPTDPSVAIDQVEPDQASSKHVSALDPPTQTFKRAGPAVVEPFPGVRVFVDHHEVELRAISCLDAGWLEQIACSPNTREHESLLVVIPMPSQVHAAMLMAGFQPGQPGFWEAAEDDSAFTDGYRYRPPTGDEVEVFVRYETDSGPIERPIRDWIRGNTIDDMFPDSPWVFAGSVFAENPEFMGPGEHYVADMTGSVIGLVTFGDEVIGWTEVIPDEEAVAAPVWRVREEAVAPYETEVTLILRRPNSER